VLNAIFVQLELLGTAVGKCLECLCAKNTSALHAQKNTRATSHYIAQFSDATLSKKSTPHHIKKFACARSKFVKIISIILIACAAYLLLHTRSFVFLALLVAFLAMFIFKKYSGEHKITNAVGRIVLVFCSAGLLVWYFSNEQQLGELAPEELLKTAEITQKDFQTNDFQEKQQCNCHHIILLMQCMVIVVEFLI
jgi:hypothetical protein